MDLLGKVGSLVSVNGQVLLFQIANFAILLFMLYKVLYHPLVTFMDKRSLKIENGLKEAEEKRQEAASDRAKATEELTVAKKEAFELLQSMRFEGAGLKEEIIKAAKSEAKDIFKRAQEDMELELKKAKDELKSEIATLSVQVAERLLKREVKIDDQQKFIEECLDELEHRA